MLAPQIITILADPLPTPADGGTKLQFLTVSGSFFNYSKIAFVVGILIALPVIIYELWAFVSPGLTDARAQGRAALDPGRHHVLPAGHDRGLRHAAVRHRRS